MGVPSAAAAMDMDDDEDEDGMKWKPDDLNAYEHDDEDGVEEDAASSSAAAAVPPSTRKSKAPRLLPKLPPFPPPRPDTTQQAAAQEKTQRMSHCRWFDFGRNGNSCKRGDNCIYLHVDESNYDRIKGETVAIRYDPRRASPDLVRRMVLAHGQGRQQALADRGATHEP